METDFQRKQRAWFTLAQQASRLTSVNYANGREENNHVLIRRAQPGWRRKQRKDSQLTIMKVRRELIPKALFRGEEFVLSCLFKWKLECELKNGVLRFQSGAHCFGRRRALGGGTLIIDFWSMNTLFVPGRGIINAGYKWKLMLINGILAQLLPWTPSPAAPHTFTGAAEQLAFCRNIDKLIHCLWKHISTWISYPHFPANSVRFCWWWTYERTVSTNATYKDEAQFE